MPRNIYTKVKFDRTTGLYLITNLSDSKNFVGTGSKYNFDLDWPMDMKTTSVSVTVSGQELLRSQFSYSNFKDNKAASSTCAFSSGVSNSGCSFNKVLNNQQPAFECRDSSLILHSTI